MGVARTKARADPTTTVVICTHNRAERLKTALASVLAQPDAPAFEVIVVDNASSDHTQQVFRHLAGDPRVRYLYEAEPGLNRARNAGWRAAHGRYVCYLDDDAVVEPGWLKAALAGFEATPGSPGVVGGRVLPVFEGTRPSWLEDEIALSLTIIDWGPVARPLLDLDREWLAGANFAIPRRLLEDIGGFHPWLDRAGEHLLSSGDVLLQKQIQRRGHVCLYQPSMTVRHAVPASRLTPRWFRRRYFWQGVSDAMMEIIMDRPTRSTRALRAGRRALALALSRRARSLIGRGHEPRALTRSCHALWDLGYVAGQLGAGRH